MKMNKIFILAVVLVLISASCKKSNKHKKNNDVNGKNTSSSHVQSQNQHIKDLTVGNINNAPQDRHPLWVDNKNNNLNRPFWHGVVGPTFKPEVAEVNKGFNQIASPMPRADVERRIVAHDLPERTYSPSSFDLPNRSDVVQVNVPAARITTIEEKFDPRLPPKVPVEKVSGILYHGTGSTDEAVVHGYPTFLEKKAHKKHKKQNFREDARVVHKEARKNMEGALGGLNNIQERVGETIDPPRRVNFEDQGVPLIMDVAMTNPVDTQFLPSTSQVTQETPASVRYRHTPKKSFV